MLAEDVLAVLAVCRLCATEDVVFDVMCVEVLFSPRFFSVFDLVDPNEKKDAIEDREELLLLFKDE